MLYEAFCKEFSKLDTPDDIHSILNIEHDYYFLNKIEEINVVLGQRQLENIITTLNIITNRNSYDKVDSMKKLHIQKSISWCEKHDISSVKLHSSNNIFLSNIYEDGTPISVLKHNNNAFLKNKSSNFTNSVYHGGGGAYNKTKVTMPLPTEPENTTNDISLDVTDMTDVSEIKNTDNSE
jgi:polyphosphate kinase